MDKIFFGSYIKLRRKELGLTQQDIAKVLLCSKQAISKYENDMISIDLSLLDKFAKVLKVDLTSFIKRKNELNNHFIYKFNFDSNRFKNSLRYLREERMISQKEIAKSLNISNSKFSKIENGLTLPSIEEFIALASLFNVSYERLYFGLSKKEESAINLDKTSEEIINNNSSNINLNDKKKGYLKTLLRTKPVIIAIISLIIFFSLSLVIALPLTINNNHIAINQEEDLHNLDTFNKYFEYSIDNNGIVISKYKGEETNLTIPGIVDNKKVYKINSFAFESQPIIRLKIEEGIEEIEDNAFNRLYNLTEVSLPASLKILGKNAFNITYSLTKMDVNEANPYFKNGEYGDLYSKDGKIIYRHLPSSMTSFTIKEGVEIIYSGAFDSDYTLKEIIFPSSLKRIESLAFIDCYLVEELILNEGLEFIGSNAFFGCSSINEVRIPSTVKKINGNPFTNTLILKEIAVDEANPNFISKDGILYSKDLKELYAIPTNYDVSKLIIDQNVEVIKEYAISFSTSLISLILPSTLNTIESYAIYNNKSLKYIILEEGIDYLKDFSFVDNNALSIYYEGMEIPPNRGDFFIDNGGDFYFKDEWEYQGDYPVPINNNN